MERAKRNIRANFPNRSIKLECSGHPGRSGNSLIGGIEKVYKMNFPIFLWLILLPGLSAVLTYLAGQSPNGLAYGFFRI